MAASYSPLVSFTVGPRLRYCAAALAFGDAVFRPPTNFSTWAKYASVSGVRRSASASLCAAKVFCLPRSAHEIAMLPNPLRRPWTRIGRDRLYRVSRKLRLRLNVLLVLLVLRAILKMRLGAFEFHEARGSNGMRALEPCRISKATLFKSPSLGLLCLSDFGLCCGNAGNDGVELAVGHFDDTGGSFDHRLALPVVELLCLLASGYLPPIRFGRRIALAISSGPELAAVILNLDSEILVRHASTSYPDVSLCQTAQLAGDHEPSPVNSFSLRRSAFSCWSSRASSLFQ
jgi:hypothetical protein